MKNADYWRKRSSLLGKAAQRSADRCVSELEEMYLEAQRTVQADIERWYGRFATNNGISLIEAKKLLTAGQLEEFKWDVDKYIKMGQQANLSPEMMKKLENASARFHISRLEAIQLQIQQQVELLYGNQLDSVDSMLREVVSNGYTHTAYEIQKGLEIGWDITALDQRRLDMLLSKPWTADGLTFRDRCWAGKANLVSGIQSTLVQGLLRGDSPAKMTEDIKKKFGVSRYQAGRLVHTETAYFSVRGSLEAYKETGVEQVEILETLDKYTCELCGGMDKKVIPLSECEAGVTVPPFHPNCRGDVCPHFDDNVGERIARDVMTGETFHVPSDMTYEQWKAKQDELHGAGTVDRERKKSYNVAADREQFERYQDLLGKKGVLADFDAFQNLKYSDPDGYEDLKSYFAYKKQNPDSSREYFNAERARQALVDAGVIRARGTVVKPPSGLAVIEANNHALQQMSKRNITQDVAQSFIDNALFALRQQNGSVYAYYSSDGFAAVGTDGILRTAGKLDEGGKRLYEEVKKHVGGSKP